MCNGNMMMSVCLGNSKSIEIVKKGFRTCIGRLEKRGDSLAVRSKLDEREGLEDV
jgi:hypothetical protein